jgi:hypothetical protein
MCPRSPGAVLSTVSALVGAVNLSFIPRRQLEPGTPNGPHEAIKAIRNVVKSAIRWVVGLLRVTHILQTKIVNL